MLRFSPLFPRRCKVNKACLRSIGWHEKRASLSAPKTFCPLFLSWFHFLPFPFEEEKPGSDTLSHSEPNPGLKAKIEGEMGRSGLDAAASRPPPLIWFGTSKPWTQRKRERWLQRRKEGFYDKGRRGKGMVVCKHASSYFPSWKWSSIFQKVK